VELIKKYGLIEVTIFSKESQEEKEVVT